MRVRNVVVALVVSSILVGAVVWLTAGDTLPFKQTEYYIFPLGGTLIDLESLSASAKADEYTVIRYDGNSVVAYAGESLATEPVDVLLASGRLLIVDAGRFLLRVSGEAVTYAVRPSSVGLELVFSPHEDLSIDAVVAVLQDLQQLGIIGDEVDFGFQSFAKDDLKGPAPPAGARIESDLYWLAVAEDWHAFAAFKSLTLVGLRVEVVAEKLPGSGIPVEYAGYVTSESESLARLLLPIDQLVSLATSGSVGLVRQAYEPVAP